MPSLALIGLLASPIGVSPDGVEMAMAGACLWQLPLDSGACMGLEPWFWPPIFPLLAGLPTAFGMDPGLTAPWMSAMCMALLCLPVAVLARMHGTPVPAASRRPRSVNSGDTPSGGAAGAGLFAAILLLAVPAMRVHAWTGDARSLFLLLLASAAALAGGAASRRRAAVLGLLLGVACLTRPEALLYAGAVLLVATVRWRGASLPAWGGLGAVVAPYWAVLSVVAGRPVLSSRGWQSAAYGWLQILPEEAVKNELAAGSWGTPLRRVLSTSEVAASVPATIDPGRALSWFGFVVTESVPIWLGLLALLGLIGAIRARRWSTLAALAALALPALVVVLVPQAQDAVLPANNVLPLLVSCVVLAGLGVVQGTTVVPTGWRPWAAGGILVGTLTLGGMDHALEPPPDPPAATEAASWLMQEVSSTQEVAASLVSAPIVLRARRARRAVPAPWSHARWRTAPPDYLVVSHSDLPALSPLLRDLSARQQIELVKVFGTEAWVRVYRVRPAGD